MPQRTARLRQLDDGHFEFVEPVKVPAKEFDVKFEEPGPTRSRRGGKLSPAWSMGDTGVVTRAMLYDDLA